MIYLKKTGVALLPGSDFGFDKKRMLVRLSFTDFEGNNFMNEYEKNFHIDNKIIEKFAPNIVEGVNKLKKMVGVTIKSLYTKTQICC